MDLPNRLFRSDPNQLHTSSDGQKFEVRGESLIASRSFKYFGHGQGVTAYGFLDSRCLSWHSEIMSSAERESTCVINGLMHDDIIKSSIHSTDTHGYAEVIFALTWLLGFTFAPRIKGIGKSTRYSFGPPSKVPSSWAIRPHKKVNVKLFRAEHDRILRLVVSIKLKESNASDILRRFNSYSPPTHAVPGSQDVWSNHQHAVHSAVYRRPRDATGD